MQAGLWFHTMHLVRLTMVIVGFGWSWPSFEVGLGDSKEMMCDGGKCPDRQAGQVAW